MHESFVQIEWRTSQGQEYFHIRVNFHFGP
jgi:hypothetical protein